MEGRRQARREGVMRKGGRHRGKETGTESGRNEETEGGEGRGLYSYRD